MKKNKFKIYLIIGFVLLFWPILHIFALIGPYLSFLVFPYFLFFSKSKTKIIDKVIRAFSAGLIVLLFSILAAYLVSVEYHFLDMHFLPQASGSVNFAAPSNKKVDINEAFSVAVKVEGIEDAINAVKVSMNFDPQYLEAIDISTINSFASIFIEKKINNKEGFLTISGGLSHPGFSEGSGEFATFYFLAKKKGNTKINILASSSVRTNDGLGTNVSDKKAVPITVSINEGSENIDADYSIKTIRDEISSELLDMPKRQYFSQKEVFNSDWKSTDYYYDYYQLVPEVVLAKLVQLDVRILKQYCNFSSYFVRY